MVVLRRICVICGSPAKGVCSGCWVGLTARGSLPDEVKPTGVEVARALFDYDTSASKIVLAAKNGGRRDLLRLVGTELGRDLVAKASQRFDVVTWVPAARSARARRGYDHGRVLAKATAAELGTPARRFLIRGRDEAQRGRSRSDRLIGPSLRCPLALTGKRILLVDDVVTTGSSMRAAAAALNNAGAQRVAFAAVAYSP